MPGPNPYAGKFVWDSWGRRVRNDWAYDPDEGKWEISGSNGPDNYQLFDSADAATAWAQANPAASGLGSPEPSPSQNAYEASLRAMGIDPSELPMSAGQELTARVLQQHGIALPAWLQGFAGGGGSQGGVDMARDVWPNWGAFLSTIPQQGVPDAGLDLSKIDNFLSPAAGGDPYQNTIAARFLARTNQESNEQKQKMLRDFIKKVMLAGQGQKQPVSPGLIAAAMGRVAV